jgi:hypothetical protein
MQEDLYCKVYVAGAPDIAALKATLADVAKAGFERRTVRTRFLEIDVFDQSRHMSADPGDDFVRWPAYLEIFAADEVSFDDFLAALGAMLNSLRERGLRVVASCEFESELAEAMLKPRGAV